MKIIKYIFLWLVFVLIRPAMTVYGETLKTLDFNGRWPDASQRAAAIDADRYLLFLADGNVIAVLNTADLTLVSKLDLPVSTGIRALALNKEGRVLYAACGKDGLKIVNVADAKKPVAAGELFATSDQDLIFGSGIASLGERVYLADIYFGLRLIDASDPSNPFQEAHYEQVNVNSNGDLYSGGHENLAVEEISGAIYAFVLDKYRGLRVFEIAGGDITNVMNYPPSTASNSLYDTKPLTDIVIINKRYAAISDYENGIVFVDLFSDTENQDAVSITTLCNFETPGSASSLSVSGNFLYVADGNSGLQAVDITDISNSVITGNFGTSGAHSVIADGDVVFVSDSGKGLQRIDCTDKSVPTATHFFDTPSDADAVFVKDSEIYTLDNDETGEGLRIIRYSDSDDQYEMTGFCKTPGTAGAIYVEGDYAYVADGQSGMTVIDVSDPQSPDVVTSVSAGNAAGNAMSVGFAAGFAYLADEKNGILAFDISRPKAPVLAGAFNPGESYKTIRVGDKTAYAGYGTDVDIIDISDPSNMYLLGTLHTEGKVLDVVSDSRYGYISDGAGGFLLMDISDPAKPSVEKHYATAGVCEAVSLYSVYAHCAVGEAGVEVVGISDEAVPRLSRIAAYDTPGYAADICIAGEDRARFTYLADSSGGLLVFKHNDQYAGGIDEKPFTESTDDRGWGRWGSCFISSLW